MILRQDRFEVGDRVSFIEEDPYDGFGMGERHRAKHGPGPYHVEAVEDADPPIGTGHMQMVTINGEYYSGWWFRPVREPVAA